MLLFIVVSFLAAPVLPLWMTIAGKDDAQISGVCWKTAAIGFVFAALVLEANFGPHISFPGWYVGGAFAALVLLSFALCLICRWFYRRKASNKQSDDV